MAASASSGESDWGCRILTIVSGPASGAGYWVRALVWDGGGAGGASEASEGRSDGVAIWVVTLDGKTGGASSSDKICGAVR